MSKYEPEDFDFNSDEFVIEMIFDFAFPVFAQDERRECQYRRHNRQ